MPSAARHEARAALRSRDRRPSGIATTAQTATRSVEHATGAETPREMVRRSVARHEGAALRFPRGAILDRDPTHGTAEPTPTREAKRAVVRARFKDVFDSLHQ
jgi:hypothetical protein